MPRPTDPTFVIPTPSPATVFFRTFVPWQLVRFAWINLKMLRMISIGHHGTAPSSSSRERDSKEAKAAVKTGA
jgi:hypothetical protein